MRKKRNFALVFLLVVISSALGLKLGVYFGNELYKKPIVSFDSSQGVQYLECELPIFKDNSYRSEMLGTIHSGEIDVLEVYRGWRLVDTIYGAYWIPPEGVEYQFGREVMLDVPIESQFPELDNGCEAVSVLMMIEKYGVDLDKLEFSDLVPRDSTPIKKNGDDIIAWGNPKLGFVGDMSGENGIGYSIDPEAIETFLKDYVENPVDLTGMDVGILERYIRGGNPVVAWVTVGFRDRYSYEEWITPDGETIDASFNVHAMTMVGFDEDYYYFNDPYTGTKNYKVTKSRFYEVWSQMGKKAISIE